MEWRKIGPHNYVIIGRKATLENSMEYQKYLGDSQYGRFIYVLVVSLLFQAPEQELVHDIGPQVVCGTAVFYGDFNESG